MDVLVLEELDDLAEMAYLDPADGITPLRELRKVSPSCAAAKTLRPFCLAALANSMGKSPLPAMMPIFCMPFLDRLLSCHTTLRCSDELRQMGNLFRLRKLLFNLPDSLILVRFDRKRIL